MLKETEKPLSFKEFAFKFYMAHIIVMGGRLSKRQRAILKLGVRSEEWWCAASNQKAARVFEIGRAYLSPHCREPSTV